MRKLIVLFSFLLMSSAFAQEWSYSFPNGPAQWGSQSSFAACAQSDSQSPIDIESGEVADFKNVTFDQKLQGLEFSWMDSFANPMHNGHTIEVPFENGSTTKFQGESYSLKQFHFHSPSEHTLNERFYPLEIHFVHKGAGNKTLVIGVFVSEGNFNAELGEVLEKHDISHFSAFDLLPRDLNYFNYRGSLTTPPCSENVDWIVLKLPIEASKEQLKILQKINGGPNNRPLQSLNNRTIRTTEL
jgi:carbonic anhydrase